MTENEKVQHRMILGKNQKTNLTRNMPDNIRKRIIASQPTAKELATDKWSSELVRND